jgi:hypothetical protein
MGKTLSRLIIEISIAVGTLSIFIAIVMKIAHSTRIYTPHFMGLTPADFLEFGAISFLFAIALSGRRILKYMEHVQRH